MIMKKCPRCHVRIAIVNFNGGGYCKPCANTYYREYNKKVRMIKQLAKKIGYCGPRVTFKEYVKDVLRCAEGYL